MLTQVSNAKIVDLTTIAAVIVSNNSVSLLLSSGHVVTLTNEEWNNVKSKLTFTT